MVICGKKSVTTKGHTDARVPSSFSIHNPSLKRSAAVITDTGNARANMTPTLSIYLDLVRIGAALVVLLFHASFARFGGDWLKPVFGKLGTDGVVVFFVLSGLVIAYTVDVKERTFQAYTLNRLARLWSVAIPALILTVILDSIGRLINDSFYPSQYPSPTDHPVEHFVAAALFINQLWFLNVQPFSDAPFWSLCYEFWYYAFYGAFIFASARISFICCFVVVLIMGPKLWLLFPIWLAGVWVFRSGQSVKLSPILAILLFVSAPIANVVMHASDLSHKFQWHIDAALARIGWSLSY
jgi:peptidoglycan/LPS O-acetylase OafA/YrhL